MSFSTDKLRALVHKQKGAASNNRFKVFMPPINGTPKPGGGAAEWKGNTEDLDLLCTQARIPGKSILTLDRQIGIEPIKVGVGHVLPEVSLTFYLTGTYSARDYFQEWIECIVSPKPPFVAGFLEDYGKQLTIEQLDKQANKVYGVKLERAYPTTINEIELNNQAQQAVLEMTVSLAYSNYTIT
jgi:hypothetical protein